MVMGTHIATLVRMPNPSNLFRLLLLLLLLSSLFNQSLSAPTDIESLFTFKASLTTSTQLNNWNPLVPPCKGDVANWTGVLCSMGDVVGLQLENMGLSGVLNLESLDRLIHLRSLSLANNNFEGKIPDIKKLSRLQALYLSNNAFSGDIPDDTFQGMRLRKVFLANNAFTGKFPKSLSELTQLAILKMEGNQFNGMIPEFGKNLKVANFANNQFEGPIPASLSKLGANNFSGNKNLCGPPLAKCDTPSPPPSPPPPEHPLSLILIKKSSTGLTVALIVVSLVLLLIIVLLVCCLVRRRRRHQAYEDESSVDSSYSYKPPAYEAGEKKVPPTPTTATTTTTTTTTVHVKRSELTFLRDDVQRFDLQDLLRASAEILGSGNFGASYKASIGKGEAVVVKNYKQMNSVGKDEFNEHMRRLGKLNHQNLLPVLAYYYRKDEKLLVSMFVDNGSLASHLHANRCQDKPGLDWQTRLKIIKGIVKGMTYLYNELSTQVVPNGHLKSSNVLLDKNYEPLLCDYALRSVMNQDQAHTQMMAYKSPEYATTGRISRKTDVWCLGIIILEVLTGKYPENYLTQRYDSSTNLATWVNKMVKERKISEVFDKEMQGTKYSKGEMINLLKIGLSCCEEDPDSRPELKDVMKEMEGLKKEEEEDDDDDDYDESSSTMGEVNAIISGEVNRKGDASPFNR